jgi:ribonucleoside-diphosphate reductase beta chain
MKEKHEFFLNEINKEDTDLPIKIAAISAFTEGVALFSSFAMLLNFPRNGLMRGMGEIVQWSQIDETQHCTGLTYIFHKTIEENPKMWNDDNKAKIYQVAEKTIELEDKFIDLAFQLGSPRNLEANDIKQYVRFIADRRLLNMGMKNIFKVKKNPLSWVEEMVDAPSHTNFFEGRSTDYAKGTLQGSWDDVWA